MVKTYKDYQKLMVEKYTIKDLKECMKSFSYKPRKKTKQEMLHECYTYLKQSFYSQKIIGVWKKYILHKFNRTQGPAIFRRSLCNNSEDFLTMETMHEIPYCFFISYEDTHEFVYGFNILSIGTLIETDKKNPYTMEPFPEAFLSMVRSRVKYNRMFKYYNEIPKQAPDDINRKLLSIFQKLDTLGNYTEVEWMTRLNTKQLRRFIHELYDIWMYRSGLNHEQRMELCPPYGNPFRNIPMDRIMTNQIFYFENNHKNNTILKGYIYTICDAFINNIHVNSEKQSLCAIYILTTLTLVNKHAATAMPWLYSSVI